MSLSNTAPTGNTQLDALLTVMRQPVPPDETERKVVFAAVRKSIGELQSNLSVLNPAQVQRLHAAIADYEALTKAMHAEIHADLSELRQQIVKTHPTVAAAPVATPTGTPAAATRPMTLDEYVASTFPDPAQRTGINWALRHVWYAFHRLSFGIGKLFGKRQQARPPAGTEIVVPDGIDLEAIARANPEQDMLAFANNPNVLRLGAAQFKLLQTLEGGQQKILVEIGTKRYRLEIDDHPYYQLNTSTTQYEPVNPPEMRDVSLEFVKYRDYSKILLQNENVVLVGEKTSWPRQGGRSSIPKAQFITMLTEVAKRGAGGEMRIEFPNVAGTYSGLLPIGRPNLIGFSSTAPNPVTNRPIIVPKIRFVQVS